MGEDDLAGLLVPLVHGEVHDEAEAEGVLFQKIQTAAQLGANLSGQPGGGLSGVGDEVRCV